ncbi:MAG: hypothetical protein ACFFD4_27665 [Candidatus Odinarchaeota archaeon]
MFSLEDKSFFPQKCRFRFALRHSNWIALLPVKNCSNCQEAIQEVLYEPELVARGYMMTSNVVLADILVVAGEFDAKKLEVAWETMKQPKKLMLTGNCVLKTIKNLGLDEDFVTLKGCPPDQNELKTFLVL